MGAMVIPFNNYRGHSYWLYYEKIVCLWKLNIHTMEIFLMIAAAIIAIALQFYVIKAATRADDQVTEATKQTKLLMLLCEKQGIDSEELKKIDNLKSESPF